MLKPLSNSLSAMGGVKGAGARTRLYNENTSPLTVHHSVPKCFRLVLHSADRLAGSPSNNPTFHLDLPRSLFDDGEYALAVESFVASGTTYNATPFASRAWSVRIPSVSSGMSVFSARAGGAASDVVATMRGPTFASGPVDWTTCGVRVPDRTIFYGKQLDLMFTCKDASGNLLVPELDDTQVGNELLQWTLTLVVYRVSD